MESRNTRHLYTDHLPDIKNKQKQQHISPPQNSDHRRNQTAQESWLGPETAGARDAGDLTKTKKQRQRRRASSAKKNRADLSIGKNLVGDADSARKQESWEAWRRNVLTIVAVARDSYADASVSEVVLQNSLKAPYTCLPRDEGLPHHGLRHHPLVRIL